MTTTQHHRALTWLIACLVILAMVIPALDVAPSLARASGPPARATVSGSTPGPVLSGRARSLGAHDPSTMLRLAIGLRPPHVAEEEQFLRDVQTRGNPLYHRFLTAAEWNARFAPSTQDERAVVSWARSQGLTVTHRYPNRLLVDVSGRVGTIQKAFGIRINDYRIGGRTYFSNDRNPSVPRDLASVVQSVAGLDDVEVMRPHVRAAKGSLPETHFAAYSPGPVVASGGSARSNGSRGGARPHFTGGFIDPTNLWSSQAYDVNALYAQGHCCNPFHVAGSSPAQTSIAISTAAGFNINDVKAFASGCCTGAGRTLAYNLNWYNIDGTPPCCTGNGSLETTLDVEYSVAMSNSFGCYCDTAHVFVYQGADAKLSTFLDVDNQILTDGHARSFSTSWGLYESGTGSSTMDSFHNIFNQMLGQGWSLTAAAGDSGAYDDGSTLSVDYPASDPDIVAAGGSQLALNGSGSYISEVAWNGGGGGCSSHFGQPGYQSGLSTGCSNRSLPDVSLNASCSTGQALYFNGGWGGVCGTSEVAPELAGIFAQINAYLLSEGSICGSGGTGACSPFGNPNNDIYLEARNIRAPHYPFYDITSGNNDGGHGTGIYAAGTGYDRATGWGSFNALQLARAILWESIWDFHGPAVSYSGPATGVWYNTDRVVSWSITDPLISPGVRVAGVSGFTQGWDAIPADPYSHSTPGSGDSYYSGPQFPNALSGYLMLSWAGQGCHTAHVRAWDNLGYGSGDATYGPLCYDTVAPHTTASLSGTPNGCGAYTSAVQVTLSASDGSSGVNSTVYQLDGGSAQTYSGPFKVATKGTHTVTFHSADRAGNVESSQTASFWIGPSIATNPTSGVYRTLVKVAGKDFKSGEPVRIYWDSNSTPLISTSASSGCAISGAFRVPQATLGAHFVKAVGQTSHASASAKFTVRARAVLSRASGTQGASVSVRGYGFGAGETVKAFWRSTSGTLLGSSSTSSVGTSGAIGFHVPTYPTGIYRVYLVGQTSHAVAYTSFKIVPSLTISPASGARGSKATVSGRGYGAHESVKVRWNCGSSSCSNTTVLATATTNGSGSFSGLSVTIPKTATVGTTYPVGGKGVTSGAFACTKFRVTS